jgi:putative ubiquitin-RnfH superfamily antitoxin RatB of RatAB toxin-antitoxin module
VTTPGRSAAEPGQVTVEVAYALPEVQALLEVSLPAGATVRQAIERSGILSRFPAIDLSRQSVGVFGRRVELDDTLRDRDRVEIYRPLAADPKEMRRQRARRTRR